MSSIIATSPLMRVAQGESFVVETEDAGSGLVRSADVAPHLMDFPTRNFEPPKGNPIGGPVFVEGAERGDLLEVTVERIIVDEQGFTNFRPGQSPLGDSHKWQSLRGPFVHIIKHLPGPSGTTSDGKGIFNDKITWDLAPMIGTIGTAPDREVETSAVGQGPWGGNLDVRDIKEGTRVYLNVYHEGGLLYVGDVHASQGDTEFYGTADETRGELTLSCRVIKNKTIPFVRLEKDDSIVALYSFRPLEGRRQERHREPHGVDGDRVRGVRARRLHARLHQPRLPRERLPDGAHRPHPVHRRRRDPEEVPPTQRVIGGTHRATLRLTRLGSDAPQVAQN